MTSHPAASLYQSAYERLRADLISGRIKPGTKLKIAEIARAQGVSAAGIREALSRLAAEGFAVAEPQKGYRVAPVSQDELQDLTHVRTHIENDCLELAIGAGDYSWEATILGASHRLSRISKDEQVEGLEPFGTRWRAAHYDFHFSLVAACPSNWFLRLREQLWWQSERYRSVSVALAGTDRDIQQEHSDLAEAVLARDAMLAKRLMEKHLARTAGALLNLSHF
ncbi:GntR family transcriptional regulator [Roseovarius amoyensis]|uniref:GntR family transcriptional regulator n=1 Tax=Roseovarius amoyensis TaxID=2211448 RepID=UPI000DBE4542|nr:GntR family transcriptional regulator [Roseovarius amoyensis]